MHKKVLGMGNHAIQIKIALLELMEDYVEAFNLHVTEPTLQPKVFDWIESSLE
jgi:hypothetical protein